jgi:hypothetical protein
MACENTERCSYFSLYGDKSCSRQHRLLVEGYCEGQLHSRCRRVKFEEVYLKEAPEELAPNGYLTGTHKKLRIENTRKHKRYNVKDGTCLLQTPNNKKTFSAEVIDLSEGGLKLALKIDPQEIIDEPDSGVMRILGHTIEDNSLLISKEFIKMVWQNNQIIGCSFLPAPA